MGKKTGKSLDNYRKKRDKKRKAIRSSVNKDETIKFKPGKVIYDIYDVEEGNTIHLALEIDQDNGEKVNLLSNMGVSKTHVKVAKEMMKLWAEDILRWMDDFLESGSPEAVTCRALMKSEGI